MDFYFADHDGNNTGILPQNSYLDIDVGKDNDFKMTISLNDYNQFIMEQGGYFYSPGTEFGGILNSFEVDTEKKEVSFEGKTFRGMLEDQYTTVPSGQDYTVVNGDVQSCMRSLFGETIYDGLIIIPDILSGENVSNLQITRYCSFLDAIYEILNKANRRPVFKIVESESNDIVAFHVELTSEPIRDLSDEVENSQDGLVNFVIRKSEAMKYEYILALGSGELKDRVVVNLKINSNGNLSEVASIPNTARVYKYDYPSAESRESLIDEAAKKVAEINKNDSQKITLSDDANVWIDDVIGGRDYVTGTYIKEKVKSVIYKYSNHSESFSYSIGDD